jgi:hypothetical protein
MLPDAGAQAALVGDEEISQTELVEQVLLTYQRAALAVGTDQPTDSRRTENPCRQ